MGENARDGQGLDAAGATAIVGDSHLEGRFVAYLDLKLRGASVTDGDPYGGGDSIVKCDRSMVWNGGLGGVIEVNLDICIRIYVIYVDILTYLSTSI